MARAMWKASLVTGDAAIPVKLYSAVEDKGVHFRLLHQRDHVPVEQRMIDPKTGQEVSREHIVRGLELERGLFVVLRDEELEALRPKPSRDIAVTRVVARSAIDPSWFHRPYYLGPDGQTADYFALSRVLEQEDWAGIAHWVMRSKRYHAALVGRGGHLALLSLFSADEVVSADQLSAPGGPPLRKEERALAEQLVASLDAPFDPSALEDEWRERVLELIEAKAKGKRLALPKAKRPHASEDLSAALRQSLKKAKGARVAA